MRRFALLAVLLVACGDNKAVPDASTQPPFDDAPAADAAPADGNPLEPDTLAGTGLCLDAACTQISPDVHEYAPQYVLWADTATKRRWIFIPTGKQIDTTDMDHWVFPAGTKIWKEFTRDGVRVETRYIAKIMDSAEGPTDPSPWFYVSYQWNSSPTSPMGDSTIAVTAGVTHANGTNHDIPSRTQCRNCHEELVPGRVLGFGAMSLDFKQSNAALLDLDGAIAQSWLTTAPPGAASPHFPLPADADAADLAAFGYMHANCGHCHNANSDIFANQTPVSLRLDVNKLDHVANTPLFASTIGRTGGVISAANPPDPAGCAPILIAGVANPQPGCTQVIVPAWATATAYKFGDRIEHGGNVYICSQDTDPGNTHACGTSAAG